MGFESAVLGFASVVGSIAGLPFSIFLFFCNYFVFLLAGFFLLVFKIKKSGETLIFFNIILYPFWLFFLSNLDKKNFLLIIWQPQWLLNLFSNFFATFIFALALAIIYIFGLRRFIV